MGCCLHEFKTPQFNLTCNQWFDNAGVTGPPDNSFNCALVHPQRGPMAFLDLDLDTVFSLGMWLLVPKGTDLRCYWNNSGVVPAVEVPAGSGRLYLVLDVDDVSKGYPSEFRVGLIAHDFTTIPHPMP